MQIKRTCRHTHPTPRYDMFKIARMTKSAGQPIRACALACSVDFCSFALSLGASESRERERESPQRADVGSASTSPGRTWLDVAQPRPGIAQTWVDPCGFRLMLAIFGPDFPSTAGERRAAAQECNVMSYSILRCREVFRCRWQSLARTRPTSGEFGLRVWWASAKPALKRWCGSDANLWCSRYLSANLASQFWSKPMCRRCCPARFSKISRPVRAMQRRDATRGVA